MNIAFLEKNVIFRPTKSKTRFLERFFDFFTKTPNFSPNRYFLPKNRSNFFVFRDVCLIPTVCDGKCPILKWKPIFSRKCRKPVHLERFFIFFEPSEGAILTLNESFWPILGAKNINFSKIVQYVSKCVSRAIFRPNFHFSALKNSKSSF